MHAVFIDLEKVYDIVSHQEMWRCMREKKVSEKYATIVNNMNKKITYPSEIQQYRCR